MQSDRSIARSLLRATIPAVCPSLPLCLCLQALTFKWKSGMETGCLIFAKLYIFLRLTCRILWLFVILAAEIAMLIGTESAPNLRLKIAKGL